MPERSRQGVLLSILSTAIWAASLSGCSEIGPETCSRPETELPKTFSGGSVESGVYMSSAWDGELLDFPGGAYYRLEHKLGAVPRWWMFYLSFELDGLGSGSLAQAAGNQVEVKGISDEAITVVNGSCAAYFLLAVAGVGDVTP